MFALLPPGSIHYFKIPGRTPAERAKQPVIIAELLEYTWLENKEREGGRIHGLYLAQSITPRQFQELPKRPLFALMGWEVTERSLG